MAKSKTGKSKDSFAETVKTVVYAVLIAVVFRTFLFQPFWIPSGSMKSTLLIGDYLFISKFAYGYSKHSFPWSLAPFDGRILGSTPDRGDVAVFKHPRTGEDYIKRVVGLPGDTIQVREGVLYINGEAARQDKIGFFVEAIDPARTRCIEKRQIEGELRCIKEAYRETFPDGRSHIILNADGSFEGIVAEVGGFLDIGDKHVHLSLTDVSLTPIDDGKYVVVTNYTKEQLMEMPDIDESPVN